MATLRAQIDFPEITEKLDQLQHAVNRLEVLLTSRTNKEADSQKPVPLKTAIAELGTTFPTFKKYCTEFNVRVIRRGNRVFVKATDLKRISDGKK